MKKLTFKEYLKDHIKRAEKAGATCEEFDKVKRVKTQASFLKIMADNISYLYDKKIVKLEHLQFFDQKELLKVGIYITGNHSIDKGAVFIGGDVTINDVWGGTINDVRGGTINDVRGGTINDVWGGTIKYVRGGTINDVWGNIDRIEKISNLGVVKCMKENKIYIKKGKFKIVEL